MTRTDNSPTTTDAGPSEDPAGPAHPPKPGAADAARPGLTPIAARQRSITGLRDSPAVDVERAAAALAGVARRTRVVASAHLSSRVGAPVWLKCENEQHTGSFKLRGAYTAAALGDPDARARGVVAASAGNHAQGVAFAAARFHVPAEIFVPAGANPLKVARTRRWGARVNHVPGGVAAALAAADEYAAAGHRLLVHPFDDPTVISGQATIGLELLEQVPDLATVVVGVGGGGLVTGLAVAIKERRPDVRIIGVQAEGAPSFARSWRAGHLVEAPTATIADGMAVARAGRLTLELASSLLDDVVTVGEEAFWAAMATLLREDGQVVEPAGAAGTAALLAHPGLAQGPTAVILSGGNIDLDTARTVETLAARPLAAVR
ncbi:MAG: threonine ammonia-lyase [Frankia sp.]